MLYCRASRVVNIAILKVLHYYWQYFVKYRLAIANTFSKKVLEMALPILLSLKYYQ